MSRFHYGDDDHYWVAPAKLLSIVRGDLQRDIIVQNLLWNLEICNDLHIDMSADSMYIQLLTPQRSMGYFREFHVLVHPSYL